MMYGSRPATKLTWYLLFVAMTLTVAVYGLIVFIFVQTGVRFPGSVFTHTTLRPVLFALAIVNLFAAMGIAKAIIRKKTPVDPGMPIGAIPRPSPQVFQTATIVALGMSEACAVMGLLLFLLGESPREFLIFAMLTVLFNFAYILPQGINYWSSQNNQTH